MPATALLTAVVVPAPTVATTATTGYREMRPAGHCRPIDHHPMRPCATHHRIELRSASGWSLLTGRAREERGVTVRLLDRFFKPTVARLVAECIEEERVDALYRYRVHSDPARLTIHPTAVVNNAIFNTGGGRITVGEYVFFGHNVCILAGVHEVDKFGLERQRAIPRSGYDVEIGEGAWLATNVMVAGPVKIGAHAVVGGGSVVRKDVEPYAVVAGNPARLIRYLTPPEDHRQGHGD